MTIEEIKNLPEAYDNIHESVFKSYHALNKMKEMLKRGDSIETIFEVLDLIYPNNTEFKNDDLPF